MSRPKIRSKTPKVEKLPKRRKDKYDRAIEHLLAQPDFKQAVLSAWSYPAADEDEPNPAHCLFQSASPSGQEDERSPAGERIGCLTQIRITNSSREYLPLVAWTPELTKEIAEDESIPMSVDEVTPESLPVFAEWQRKLDRTIRRKLKATKKK